MSEKKPEKCYIAQIDYLLTIPELVRFWCHQFDILGCRIEDVELFERRIHNHLELHGKNDAFDFITKSKDVISGATSLVTGWVEAGDLSVAPSTPIEEGDGGGDGPQL